MSAPENERRFSQGVELSLRQEDAMFRAPAGALLAVASVGKAGQRHEGLNVARLAAQNTKLRFTRPIV